MTRLCFIPGTWQLVTAVAALREEGARARLVLYEPDGVPELRWWMDNLARRLWPPGDITWDDELHHIRPDGDRWPLPLHEWRRRARCVLGDSDVSELWVPHLEGFYVRLIAEVFSRARLVLYEDGYLNPVPCRRNSHYIRCALRHLPALLAHGKLREHLASLRLCDSHLPEAYVRRIDRMLLLLADDVPVPLPYRRSCVHPMGSAALNAVLDEIDAMPDVRAALTSIGGTSERDVLFLGQTFHATGKIDRATEFEIQRAAVKLILDKGYSVWWKDHPREKDSFLPALESEFGSERVRRARMPAALPVQLALRRVNIRACVAVNSSTLFYLPRLQGLTAYSMAARYIAALCRADAEYLCLPMVAERLPSVESMPGQHGAESRIGRT